MNYFIICPRYIIFKNIETLYVIEDVPTVMGIIYEFHALNKIIV